MQRNFFVNLGIASLVCLALTSKANETGAQSEELQHPMKTEVHAVGLHQATSASFQLMTAAGFDTDWVRLGAEVVRQGKSDVPSPGKRIWHHLSDEARVVVANPELLSRVNVWAWSRREPFDFDTWLQFRNLPASIEKMLKNPDFYDKGSFSKVNLDGEAKELLNRKKPLLPLESLVLNRRLYEAAFPEAVKRWPSSLKQHTVPVRVKAGRAPIILVLSSYNSILWDVQPDKGARIERIIIGGYHTQSVTDTAAPVTYCVYEQDIRSSPFYPYKTKTDEYRKMVREVRAITGLEVTSFQGRYTYDEGPALVVGSSQ